MKVIPLYPSCGEHFKIRERMEELEDKIDIDKKQLEHDIRRLKHERGKVFEANGKIKAA